MRRRAFVAALGGTSLGGCVPWPEEGLFNPCLPPRLPPALARHRLVAAAWRGIDLTRVWDVHAHLLGTGDSGSGMWINPRARSWLHPLARLQFGLFRNAACAGGAAGMDRSYLDRLMACQDALPPGPKLMLLALDHTYGPDGRRRLERSAFYTPNRVVAGVAAAYPARVEWIASVHPYRPDWAEALARAVRGGARAVKWIPSAMGIDPASPRCDRFYGALNRADLPLLVHAGDERAVRGMDVQRFGNPLRLRRALEQGVRVIVAHCASLGEGVDLDRPRRRRRIANFELFARLMDEPGYEGRLFGDISSLTQWNRFDPALRTVIRREAWHPRLLNGSDYPLPGLLPMVSLSRLVEHRLLDGGEAAVISALRRHNPLLFDFVLKRTVRAGRRRLGAAPFETRPFFERAPARARERRAGGGSLIGS